ncbi:P-loop containing nucleoside triphosphate hydrolase protein [Dunaliella salina]|nr:P-loop containing nucleoside triphosphate hydrolase protein [Dunaliella salina]|eukprot:KAF5831722.1 P-loop containing nucleoside triphosphate hydrolase protein [Dunaliella salina]
MRRILDDRSGTKKKRSDSKAQAVSTTFRDVAGVDSAKEELLEVVDVMKKAKSSYTKLKVKMPSGVLLCGPPGTGKTLLAKAVAGEAGIPFLAVSASEFVELFVGRGAARIRELFTEARKATPCVIFIDELDAVGAKRGLGYNDERDQTLNQLLTELDGFEGRQGVLFLAATNRIDVLDPALLRPGRINRKVVVPLPDEQGRQDILNVHLRGVPMSSAEEKAEAALRLARVTAGFSGAELANVVNESALLAARKDQDNVTLRECLEGVRRTKFGVNGQSSNPIAKRIQDWLMDIATGPIDRKVGNIAA